jgi:protein-S-isoprenylcysteine O-methyltransferase Ste14
MSIPIYVVSAFILIAFAFITFRIIVRRSYRDSLRTFSWLGIAIGLTVMFILIFWFGWLRAMGQKVSTLIQSGPYRISRNPQSVACGIAVIGYALLGPSWHTLGWVILFSVIIHMMVLTEEEHLREIFGEEYVKYCARVPRYIGVRKGRIR